MRLVQFPELGINLEIDPVAFSVFGLDIMWYGVIIAAGFLLGATYAVGMCKKMNINSDNMFDAIIAGLVLGIIGARLYYVIFYPGDKFINNPLEIFDIRDGGMAIYGSIIGGLLGGALVCKYKKIKVMACLDAAVLGFLIGQGIGRWGNFINQEAFGTGTDLPWGMMSENTVRVIDGPVHPTFLYESLLCIIGFIVLHFFNRYHRKYDGQTFLLYLVWYGITRFFVEGLRTDSLIIPGTPIRVSQALALLTVIAGIALLIKFRKSTSLIGCGNKEVMKMNNVVFGSAEVKKEKKQKRVSEGPVKSTLFANEEFDPNADNKIKATDTSDEEIDDNGDETDDD